MERSRGLNNVPLLSVSVREKYGRPKDVDKVVCAL